MEWLVARPRIPVVQKQIPFVSFRAHGRGLCILWCPVICQSVAWRVGAAGCRSDRLVANLSQRSPFFRRNRWSLSWTCYGLSCVGTTRAAGGPISAAFFCLVAHKWDYRSHLRDDAPVWQKPCRLRHLFADATSLRCAWFGDQMSSTALPFLFVNPRSFPSIKASIPPSITD